MDQIQIDPKIHADELRAQRNRFADSEAMLMAAMKTLVAENAALKAQLPKTEKAKKK